MKINRAGAIELAESTAMVGPDALPQEQHAYIGAQQNRIAEAAVKITEFDRQIERLQRRIAESSDGIKLARLRAKRAMLQQQLKTATIGVHAVLESALHAAGQSLADVVDTSTPDPTPRTRLGGRR